MNRASHSIHEVISVREINSTVFKVRLTRNNLEFKTGQHINVGPASGGYTREYSIYSGENDDYLEILVKEVLNGLVSPELHKLKKGNQVMVEPPLGYFYLPTHDDKKMLFIATGTGIAPYHSFIKTHPQLNYHLLHGVSEASEACEKDFYKKENFTLCTSKKSDGDFHGRVTKWLNQNPIDNYRHIYLCGNRNMINEVHSLLKQKGFPMENIHAEAYF